MKQIFFTITFLISLIGFSQDLVLPTIFSDGIVLQQDTSVDIWGWGTPNSTITITPSWGEPVSSQVNSEGRWRTKVETIKASFQNYSLEIKNNSDTITIQDVLLGEVWLCSGQSNMDMPLKGWGKGNQVENAEEVIKNANHKYIKMFNAKKYFTFSKPDDVDGSWKITNPENAKHFSAAAYFFAKKLFTQLNIPIGIVHSSHGSSAAEAWMDESDLKKVTGFENISKDLETVAKNKSAFRDWKNKLSKVTQGRNIKAISAADTNDKLYTSTNYDDSNWKQISIKKSFNQTKELFEFSGIVYYRKSFELDKDQLKGKNFTLKYKKPKDANEIFINGNNIGNTFDLKGDVNLEISKKYLKKGKNTITIKIFDIWGDSYFKNIPTISKNESDVLVTLKGDWKYRKIGEIIGKELYVFDEENNLSNQPEMPYKLNVQSPTVLYNGMLKPLIGYTIKGFTWYQGESNTHNPNQYKTLFPELIKSWRTQWKQGDLPFYFVQICPYQNYDNDKGKESQRIREAQFLTQKLPNTGIVSTSDIGHQWFIHPPKKKEVGERLALWALAKDYKKDIVCSGPQYKTASFEDNKAILSFDYVGSGLELKGDDNGIFEIAGEDGVFYPATPTIENEQIVLTSKEVTKPVKARYGWSNWIEASLFNKEGLSAPTFRTYED